MGAVFSTARSKASPKKFRLLEYDSLKTVIQHLDPNVRFKLCLHLPSIRKVDRAVPLKIHHLDFKPYQFIVNGVVYRLGTMRDYGSSAILTIHQEQNDEGGVPWDLDTYGFPFEAEVTPGDVVIRDERWPMFRGPQTEEQAERVEAQLRINHYILARKQGKDVGPVPIMENDPNYFLLAQNEFHSVNGLQRLIGSQLNQVMPFRYKRSGFLPPYRKFVRLSIGGTITHDFPEDFAIHQVQKRLNDVLFGQRNLAVYAKRLMVECNDIYIRLPLGLKFRIRKLTTDHHAVGVCKGIEPILSTSSFPLQSLTMIRFLDDYNHQILSTAQKLVMADDASVEEWLPIFLNLQNKRIVLKYSQFSVEDYVQIVQHLLDSPREPGTWMSFGIPAVEMLARILGRLEKRFEQAKGEPRCIKIPIKNQQRHIDVWYDSSPTPNQYLPQWNLMVKVRDDRKKH